MSCSIARALSIERDIELRFTNPVLTSLSAGYQPPADAVVVSTDTSAMARAAHGAPQGPPIVITWSVELNYLRISQLSDPVGTSSDSGGNGATTSAGGRDGAAA